jgi:glucokinase
MFASIYGNEAGNMALRCLAKGGVILGGGIAPKLLPVLRRGGFTESFFDKGKFSGMMRGTRVVVATNPRTPLQGAAEFARATLERG